VRLVVFKWFAAMYTFMKDEKMQKKFLPLVVEPLYR